MTNNTTESTAPGDDADVSYYSPTIATSLSSLDDTANDQQTGGSPAVAAKPTLLPEKARKSNGGSSKTTSATTSSSGKSKDNATSSSTPSFYRLNAFHREEGGSSVDDYADEPDQKRHSRKTHGGGEDQSLDLSASVNSYPMYPPEVEEAMLRSELGYNEDANGDTTAMKSSTAKGKAAAKKKKRGVRFRNVYIREYAITIGCNPYCSHGVPICLDWSHGEEESIPIDFYEASHHKRKRTARRMLLNSFQRRDMLWRSGYTLEDINKAIKENDREKFRRSMTVYFLPLLQIQEMMYFGFSSLTGGSKKDDDTESCASVQELVVRQQRAQLEKHQHTADTEIGGMNVVEQYEREKPRRRLSFKSQTQSIRGGGNKEGGAGSVLQDWSLRSGSAFSDLSHDRDDPYAASINSRFKEYSVRVDRSQHDKASEIILCNMQRPHMRAFHAAWMTFFTAFFMWFAITPLLGEVKETLNLSKSDIWYSSLCGTAGTIIMRILMGPACDKFGARICMAFILATSAIPCALTGLVQTAQGLSIVRTFIGVAGSSFVACQYWTSQMFTREVAGTANALVAGWGNLGGGITQLVMGSALFPLFKLFYGGDDSERSELAWRTVFVVPAVVSLVASYVIWAYCDDSPKGDYRERVRQQEITVVSPTASLCAAAQNRNVMVLLIQYACCFGVEVTMTNATALYFRDEFGQSTVSAAAIASGENSDSPIIHIYFRGLLLMPFFTPRYSNFRLVFGIMNLFARGIGGFVSDLFNSKYGMRGRVMWQGVTLLLEGAAVVVFGFADTLPGSILALIFLSMMVQSAEGSTFGIVPYVDRRYTGKHRRVVGQ